MKMMLGSSDGMSSRRIDLPRPCSSSAGSIRFRRTLSEKRGRTDRRPLRKLICSGVLLDGKWSRSRKRRVETRMLENQEQDCGRLADAARWVGDLRRSELSRSAASVPYLVQLDRIDSRLAICLL
jgi:hypothetical protein